MIRRDVDHSTAAEFFVRTGSISDQPRADDFGQVSTAHHSVSVQMVSVASSVTKDKHEDFLTPAECGAHAEREAKKRRVEWTGRPTSSDRSPEPVGVRDDKGELVEIGAQSSKMQATQVAISNEVDDFDESGPSSLDEVALARQASRLWEV